MTTPMLSYLVCATPRSGSTLLCHELDRTGVAGHPEEYFEALRKSGLPRRPHEYFDPERHANIVERLAFREMPESDAAQPSPLWHPDTYGEYLAWALQEGTTPNGVFGAKLMWGYLGDFAELLRGMDGMAERTLPGSARPLVPGAALPADHAPGQGSPGGLAVEGRPDAGLEARGRGSGTERRRAGVLLPRDQLPRPAPDRARRLLGRVLPRARLRAAEDHLRGARGEHRRRHQAGAGPPRDP